jgi:hypothetical protein
MELDHSHLGLSGMCHSIKYSSVLRNHTYSGLIILSTCEYLGIQTWGYNRWWESVYDAAPATFPPITQMSMGTIAGKCYPI